ncbi:hypothetical protein HYU11_06530 [Candidatus Woesearchaeota archaeon]|nr:hypothetical protein [Candidatus Woesearchaeota archaeon]
MLDLIQGFFSRQEEEKSVKERPGYSYSLFFTERICMGCNESFLYNSLKCPVCGCSDIKEQQVMTGHGLRRRG